MRDEYLNLRAAAGRIYDWDDIAGAVLSELEEDDGERRYRHVVVDEGQDFSPQMLKSLAAAIPKDGSLSFFGDMAQQIYGGGSLAPRRASRPSRCLGFRRNYRNTPEIADLGLAIANMPYYKGVPDMVEPDELNRRDHRRRWRSSTRSKARPILSSRQHGPPRRPAASGC